MCFLLSKNKLQKLFEMRDFKSHSLSILILAAGLLTWGFLPGGLMSHSIKKKKKEDNKDIWVVRCRGN